MVSGKTVTGAGDITVTAVGASTNLTNVNPTGGVTANLNDGVDISANSQLGNIDNITFTSGADATLTIAQQNKITAGDGSNTITLSEAGTVIGSSFIEIYNLFNASGNDFTAAATGQTVVGTASVDIIRGGDGADTITGGDGLDALTGGGGGDRFVFDSTDAFTNVDSSSVYETISDFTTASDTLYFGAAVDAYSEVSGHEFVASSFDTRANAFFDDTVSGRDVYVEYNLSGLGDALLAVDMDQNNSLGSGDILIKLLGIDSANDIISTDIVNS